MYHVTVMYKIADRLDTIDQHEFGSIFELKMKNTEKNKRFYKIIWQIAYSYALRQMY